MSPTSFLYKDVCSLFGLPPFALEKFLRVWLLAALAGIGSLLVAPVSGQKLRLEFEPRWSGAALTPGQPLPGTTDEMSVSRLDGLLSQLALQRTDGTWLESRDWFVFLSVGKGRLSAVADGLPA